VFLYWQPCCVHICVYIFIFVLRIVRDFFLYAHFSLRMWIYTQNNWKPCCVNIYVFMYTHTFNKLFVHFNFMCTFFCFRVWIYTQNDWKPWCVHRGVFIYMYIFIHCIWICILCVHFFGPICVIMLNIIGSRGSCIVCGRSRCGYEGIYTYVCIYIYIHTQIYLHIYHTYI